MCKKDKLAKRARALARSQAAKAKRPETTASAVSDLARMRAEQEEAGKRQERETRQFRRNAVSGCHIDPEDHGRRFACGRAIPHFDSSDNFFIRATSPDDEPLSDARDDYIADLALVLAGNDHDKERDEEGSGDQTSYGRPANVRRKRGILFWWARGSKPRVITSGGVVRQSSGHGRIKSVRVMNYFWQQDFDAVDLRAHVRACLAAHH